MLGIESFPADLAGFGALLGWLVSHGEVEMVGVEGTGSWGVGLSRFLHDHEISVVEVPSKQAEPSRSGSLMRLMRFLQPGQPCRVAFGDAEN